MDQPDFYIMNKGKHHGMMRTPRRKKGVMLMWIVALFSIGSVYLVNHLESKTGLAVVPAPSIGDSFAAAPLWWFMVPLALAALVTVFMAQNYTPRNK